MTQCDYCDRPAAYVMTYIDDVRRAIISGKRTAFRVCAEHKRTDVVPTTAPWPRSEYTATRMSEKGS